MRSKGIETVNSWQVDFDFDGLTALFFIDQTNKNRFNAGVVVNNEDGTKSILCKQYKGYFSSFKNCFDNAFRLVCFFLGKSGGVHVETHILKGIENVSI